MRTLWSLNGIRKTVGLEPAQKDTFKKMWSEKELKELEIKTRYGENIWNQVKDDIILSGMKRLYAKKDILRLVQTWNLASPDLEGKEYLGDGWYNLVDNDFTNENNYLRYNVRDGIFEVNKIEGDYDWSAGSRVNVELINNITAPYTVSVEKISDN